jgi:hypothetical protein
VEAFQAMCSATAVEDEDPLCRECAWHHKPQEPHNAESIIFQLNFIDEHGRVPSWNDALAHCDDKTKRTWIAAIADWYPDPDAPMPGFFVQKEQE